MLSDNAQGLPSRREEEAIKVSLDRSVAPATDALTLPSSSAEPHALDTSASFQSTSASSLPSSLAGSAPRATRNTCWADLCEDEDSQSDGEPSSSSLAPVSVRSLPIRVDSDSSLALVSSDDQHTQLEAISQPEVSDSPSSLSVGSRDHASGNCHPCIFFPKSQGCVYGWHCTFCHFDHDSKARHRRHLRGGGRRQQAESGSGADFSSTAGSGNESGSVAAVEEKFLLPTALVYHAPQPWPASRSTRALQPGALTPGALPITPGALGSQPDPAQASASSSVPADSITSMLTSVFAPWFRGDRTHGADPGNADCAGGGSMYLQTRNEVEASSSSRDKRSRRHGGHQSSQSSNDNASSEATPTSAQRGSGGSRSSRSSTHGAGTDRRHKPRTR